MVKKQNISLALHKVKIKFNINIKEVPLSAIIIGNFKFLVRLNLKIATNKNHASSRRS